MDTQPTVDLPPSPAQRRMKRCDALFVQSRSFYAKLFSLTILFFLSSGGLTLYNKWIISVYGFFFPVWLVTITYGVAAMLSVTSRLLSGISCCRKSCGPLLRRAGIYPFQEDLISRREAGAIVGVGAMAAIEVASSNVSLLYLDVSYHIMLRAGIPVFVLLWAFALKLDKPSFKLVAVVVFICGGVAILTYGENMTMGDDETDSDGVRGTISEEKQFSWTGTFYVLLSCFCAGCKWALSELTLNKKTSRTSTSTKLSSSDIFKPTSIPCCSCCGYLRLSASPRQAQLAVTNGVELAQVSGDPPDEENSRASNGVHRNCSISLPNNNEQRARPKINRNRMSSFALLSTTAPVSMLSLLPIDFLSDEYEGIVNYTRAVLAGEAEFQASVEDIIANNMSTAKTILLTTVTPGENLASVHFVELALVLVGCSLIAVVLTMVTFLFIKLTSGLTLSIVNIAKQLVVVAVSIAIYGDVVTWVTLVGFGLCLVGLIWFNYVKFSSGSTRAH